MVIALFFAFTLGAFAQKAVKQEHPSVLAKSELHELSKVIELNNGLVKGINDLLVYKHEMNSKSSEKKGEIAAIIESKLKSTFTEDQFLKIKNNKELFEDLLY